MTVAKFAYKIALPSLIVSGGVFLFQNCGRFESATSHSVAKAQLLSSGSVLGGGTRLPEGNEPGSIRNPGTEPNNPPTPATPTPGPVTPTPTPVTPTPTPVTPTPTPVTPTPTPVTPTPTPVTPTPTPVTPTPTPPPPPPDLSTNMPVEMYCSYEGAIMIGTTLSQSANAMYYSFNNEAGREVCSFNEANARTDILNTSRVNFYDLASKCPNLQTGRYVILMRPGTTGRSLLMTLQNWRVAVNGLWIGQPLHVKITRNADRSMSMVADDIPPCEGPPPPLWGQLGTVEFCQANYGILTAKVLWSGTVGAFRCDRGTSPLILQLSDTVEPIYLTAPLDGIQFDIRGVNAKPPHAPMTISWLTAESAKKNYFLVLPDGAGEVRGIDQMFGDNTLGPDNLTPATSEIESERNGYEALRKWDGRSLDGLQGKADGFITEKDEVFGRLRLWLDANHDGVADKSELSTLSEHKIVSIDLKADRGFREVDAYGNETKLKSVVETDDGRLHLIYDIWFRALPGRGSGIQMVKKDKEKVGTGRALASVPAEKAKAKPKRAPAKAVVKKSKRPGSTED